MFNVKRNLNLDVTTVSNKFISKLLPKASGDCVKIYLYFLSMSSSSNKDMDLNEIARTLGYSTDFIIQALLYWEKNGVVEGAYNGNGDLISMTFLDVPEIDELSVDNNIVDAIEVDNNIDNETQLEVIDDNSNMVVNSQTAVSANGINLPLDKVESLCQNNEIRMTLMAAEQYLGHTLSPSEIELLLYLYDQCHFSTDLIDYLVEYCVSKGSKSIHYVREVGFAWYEAGIDTVVKAKSATTTYHKDYSRITKALGIKRSLGEIELEYMSKWINEYDIDTDMIVEACNRTILNVGKPQFKYTDSILNDWIAKGYKTFSDVYNAKDIPPVTKSTTKPAKTKFDFDQREYSEEEVNEYIENKKPRITGQSFEEIQQILADRA